MRERDPSLYDGQETAGFSSTSARTGRGSAASARRGSGYHIDVGLRADRRQPIKLNSRVTVGASPRSRWYRATAARCRQIASLCRRLRLDERMGRRTDQWGGGEPQRGRLPDQKDPGTPGGRARSMWRPTQQEALWFMRTCSSYQCVRSGSKRRPGVCKPFIIAATAMIRKSPSCRRGDDQKPACRRAESKPGLPPARDGAMLAARIANEGGAL